MSASASAFNKLNRLRRSVRHYLPDPIPRESIERCLEAARIAPSANNGQPWDFVVVGDNDIREKLVHAARFGPLRGNPFAKEAPVIVVVNESPGHRPTRWGGRLIGRHFTQMDIGIAVENFCLQAAEEGLGTCILGLFIASEVRRALRLPRKLKPMLLITLGRPAEVSTKNGEIVKKRKSLDSIRRYIDGEGITDGS